MLLRVDERVSTAHGVAQHVKLVEAQLVDEALEVGNVAVSVVALLGVPRGLAAASLVQSNHVKAVHKGRRKRPVGLAVAP